MQNLCVLVKGAGEIASAIGHRLSLCHLSVVMTEISHPTVVRRGVAFAQAVFDGQIEIEGMQGVLLPKEKIQIENAWKQHKIAVVVDPDATLCSLLKPDIVVDAILAKKNLGTRITDAELVIGVGPGFTAKKDVHYCIETMRGHHLGAIISQGTTMPDTGIPGNIKGFTSERVLRAPCTGKFRSCKEIGDLVEENDVIGHIDQVEVRTKLSGVIRGLIRSGCICQANLKIGDVDPRRVKEYCWQISDKSRNIAGSVLAVISRRYPPQK